MRHPISVPICCLIEHLYRAIRSSESHYGKQLHKITNAKIVMSTLSIYSQ